MESNLNLCLRYHDFSGTGQTFSDSRQTISLGNFCRQLDLLADIRNIPLNGLLSTPGLNISYCLIFDDGKRSSLHAAEELAKRNLSGTFFIVRDRTLMNPGYLGINDIREMSRMGMDFGSYTCTHRHLNKLSTTELINELVDSRMFLEDVLSKPVVSLAFPGGYFGKREIDFSIRSGYLLNCTGISGINYLPLKRGIVKSVSITDEFDLDIFSSIIDLSQYLPAKASIRKLLRRFPKYIESRMAYSEY